MDSQVFLISGEGRSGTTLLSVILNQHPNIYCAPEFHFRSPSNLGELIQRCLDLAAKDPNVTPRRLRDQPELKLGLQFVRRCERAGIPVRLLDETVRRHIHTLGHSPDTFSERLNLVMDMLNQQREHLRKPVIGFKIMRDIQLHRHYLQVLPESFFLHILRDPRDVIASQIIDHQSWGFKSVDAGIKSWNQTTQTAHQLEQAGSAIIIRYEDLVSDVQRTLYPFLSRLDVKFDPLLERHHEIGDISLTLKQHPSAEQVARPISGSSIGRFRHDLTCDQILAIERGTGSWATRFSYEFV